MRRCLLACVAAAALALAGAALAAGGLAGTFTTTISGAPSAQFDGTWTMRIAADGRYSIALGRQVLISGRSAQRSSTITFGRETGPAACKGAQAAGVYRWRVAGGRLKLTRLADRCPGRSFVLGHPFAQAA